MVTNKLQKPLKKGIKNKLKPKDMQDKEEAIEFHLINKDIWKEFINEPKQNKSSCMLVNLEIKVIEVIAKTYYYMAVIEYEVFELKKSISKTGKAVLLNQNKIRSASVAQAMVV